MRNIKTVTKPYREGILSQKYDKPVNMTFFLLFRFGFTTPIQIYYAGSNVTSLIDEIFMQQSSFILRVSIYFELTNHQRESHEPG